MMNICKTFNRITMGVMVLFSVLSTRVAYTQEVPALNASLIVIVDRSTSGCTQTSAGLACPTTIYAFLDWNKNAAFPYDNPSSPIGYWSGYVFQTSDTSTGLTIVGGPEDYEGYNSLGSHVDLLTQQQIQAHINYLYGDNIRVVSDFVNSQGSILSFNSGIPTPLAQDIGDLAMADEPVDLELTPSPQHNGSCAGDPVYLHSGQFYYNCEDLTIPGRNLDIALSHTYFSGLSFNGQFGPGWMISYYMRLHELENGNAIIVSGDGRKTEYTLSGADYISSPGRFETLVKNGNGTWTLTQAHGNKYEIDGDGKLTSIKDRNNNAIILSYSATKQPYYGKSEFAQDPLTNVILGLDYQLLNVSDTNGRVLDFTYNTQGLLESIVDNISGGGTRTITFAYDPTTNDLLTITKPATTQYPAGVTKTFTYENHNLKTITDAKGQTFVTNHYDSQGRVDQQDLGAGSFSFDYSVAAETTETNRKGFVTRHVFNGEGQEILTEQLTQGIHTGDPASFVTEMTYNVDGMQTSVEYPRGNGVKFVYDDQNSDPRTHGNLLESRRKADMAAADSATNDLIVQMTYESQFNFPKTVTDAKGYTTSYTYDYELPTIDPRYGTGGNLVQIDQPTVATGTPVTTFDYNSNGQVVMTEDPNNIVTTYDYFTATGYLKEIRRDPTGINAKTQFTYDNNGNMDTLTDANNHTTDYDFDELGWLVKVTNPLNYVTNYFHDANGNVERIERQASDPAGTWQVTQFTYDTLNNLKTIIDPLNRVTTRNYDNNENVSSIVDAETNTTAYQYDERDKLFTVTDANIPAGVTKYDYDANGNLKKITDANNNPTHYALDLFDRLDVTTYADSSTVDHDYDKNSNLDFVDFPGNHGTIDYVYDQLNRLTTVDYGSATPDKSFDYDLASRLMDADNSASQNHFDYDNLNRVQSNTQTLTPNPIPYTLSYQYDKAGNRIEIVYPSGKVVEYTYDLNDNMDLVKVNTATLTDYDYDPLDRREQKSYLSATLPLTTYSFDIANQLSSITNTLVNTTAVSQYSYPNYDQVGNRKQLTTTGTPGAQTINYAYNDIYELTGVTDAQTHSYDYDKVTNREVADAVTYVPNNLNQYSSVGGTTYTYDNNGNLTGDGVSTYTFDEENRLSNAINPTNSTNTTYSYDAFNHRVSKNVNGTVTYFINDGDREVEERDASGVLLADYVFGDSIDEVLTMTRGSNAYYYHYDGLGSVSEITNSAGVISERYEYDVYGTPTIFDGSNTQISSSTIGNRFMFTGREYDEETGLYHYRARPYDPTTGRFISRDPIGLRGGINLYGYVFNNPINYLDPWGTDTYYVNNKFSSSTPTDELLYSHSFVSITDIDKYGKEMVVKTFSFIKNNKGEWEPVKNIQNMQGAQKALDTNVGITKVGNSNLDPFIEQAFEERKNNSGKYRLLSNNCKDQAFELISDAKDLYQSSVGQSLIFP